MFVLKIVDSLINLIKQYIFEIKQIVCRPILTVIEDMLYGPHFRALTLYRPIIIVFTFVSCLKIVLLFGQERQF